MSQPMDTRCGFVALIGAPNVGKSTLLNALVGTKVSIVSRKVQTTRSLVRGIAIEGAAQIIFVDTPGIFAPRRTLDRAMVGAAWSGAADADLIALLLDARRGLDDEAKALLGPLAGLARPKVLIITKIDLAPRPSLLELSSSANAALAFEDTFMVSALKSDGLAHLRARLAARMAPGPWLYPEDQAADAPLRALAAEITREKILERLHEELPYHVTVETESWTQQKDGSARIEQTIYVTREAHKKIVIGERGQMIKSIGSAARKDIAEAAEHPVHLFLFVKVRENWMDDPARYREMGLDLPKK
ncbi:MAG TPA: GTPase Era [Beijerinckiaceae bacterium]|nr:GTPase Era [Beijerinckiaceae bacterium]